MRRWWCAHWLLLLAAVDSIQTTTPLNAQKANHNHHHHHRLSRRRFALASAATALASLPWRPLPAFARAPGSRDVEASLAQLQEASAALLTLRREWADYTVIVQKAVDLAKRGTSVLRHETVHMCRIHRLQVQVRRPGLFPTCLLHARTWCREARQPSR